MKTTSNQYYGKTPEQMRADYLCRQARQAGLDATPEFVEKHLKQFNRWQANHINRLTLITTTGIRPIRKEG